MTPEERIKGLEKTVADLAEIIAALSWGKHPHHQTSHELYRTARDQRDADHTSPKTQPAGYSLTKTGRRFR